LIVNLTGGARNLMRKFKGGEICKFGVKFDDWQNLRVFWRRLLKSRKFVSKREKFDGTKFRF
jgi:hypothetical protein